MGCCRKKRDQKKCNPGETKQKQFNSTCTKLAMFILIGLNVLLAVVGLACAIVGLYVLTGELNVLGSISMFIDVEEKLDGELSKTSIVSRFAWMFIITGVAILVIAGLGAIGAWKKKICALILYTVVTFASFFVLFILVICLFFYKQEIDREIRKMLVQRIENDYVGTHFDSEGVIQDDADSISSTFDLLMTQLECCGVDGYKDFAYKAKNWNRTYTYEAGKHVIGQVPMTCCKMEDYTKFVDDLEDVKFIDLYSCLATAAPDVTNLDGCYMKIDEIVRGSKYLMHISICVTAFIILLLGTCSLHLICCIKNEDNEDEDGVEIPCLGDLFGCD